jgi:hypothetical protein
MGRRKPRDRAHDQVDGGSRFCLENVISSALTAMPRQTAFWRGICGFINQFFISVARLFTSYPL